MYREAILSVPVATFLAYAPMAVRKLILARFNKFDNANPRKDPLTPDTTSSSSSSSPSSSSSQKNKGDAVIPKETRELLHRLKSSHENQLETLGLYAGGVAVAIAVRANPDTLLQLTRWYVKSRLAYSLAYAAPQVGNGILRRLSFIAASASCLMVYFAAANASANLLS